VARRDVAWRDAMGRLLAARGVVHRLSSSLVIVLLEEAGGGAAMPAAARLNNGPSKDSLLPFLIRTARPVVGFCVLLLFADGGCPTTHAEELGLVLMPSSTTATPVHAWLEVFTSRLLNLGFSI
jgi:hypothetical protein